MWVAAIGFLAAALSARIRTGRREADRCPPLPDDAGGEDRPDVAIHSDGDTHVRPDQSRNRPARHAAALSWSAALALAQTVTPPPLPPGSNLVRPSAGLNEDEKKRYVRAHHHKMHNKKDVTQDDSAAVPPARRRRRGRDARGGHAATGATAPGARAPVAPRLPRHLRRCRHRPGAREDGQGRELVFLRQQQRQQQEVRRQP